MLWRFSEISDKTMQNILDQRRQLLIKNKIERNERREVSEELVIITVNSENSEKQIQQKITYKYICNTMQKRLSIQGTATRQKTQNS